MLHMGSPLVLHVVEINAPVDGNLAGALRRLKLMDRLIG